MQLGFYILKKELKPINLINGFYTNIESNIRINLKTVKFIHIDFLERSIEIHLKDNTRYNLVFKSEYLFDKFINSKSYAFISEIK